jgi:hypothetical protein
VTRRDSLATRCRFPLSAGYMRCDVIEDLHR